jgi:antitoxin (DNA-binding transcriptional repressor) of toxin-antitoxin stability system
VVTVDGRPDAALRPLRRRPRWVARSEFLRSLSRRQADPGLEAQLPALSPDTTDDVDP